MKIFECFLVFILLFVAVKIHGVYGGTMVSGTVFCDQCKDGQVSIFDYPLSGMKVTMLCPGNDGQMKEVGEDTTNMLGGYGMTFDGTPDLTTCFAQISPNSNKCGVAPGPPKYVKLMFSMFDMQMFSIDPLISQPAQPMSYCSSSSSPGHGGPTPTPITLPPPTNSRPPPVDPITPSAPPKPPTPAFRLPPFPHLPHMPPTPFLQDSACSYEKWMKPEYKCYWRAVNPEMEVGMVFGPVAAQKYGNKITLWSGLKGKGDPYKTLLRETVTALLNSYNSFHFPYNAFEVLHNFNTALMAGSNRRVLLTALQFKRANSGFGHFPCNFQTCK